MTAPRREHFKGKVIEQLRGRVGLRCSNPDCRRATAGPGPGSIGVTLVGEAAHIHAAQPGGPRYIVEMTDGQRTAIDNAIWLCTICHTKVDRNPTKFKASLLRKWKALAEHKASEELGQRLPSETDAQDLLVTALAGTPKHLAHNAIANVHGAVQQHLEALDSRFLVETSYEGKVIRHKLQAKEDVRVGIKFPTALGPSIFGQLRDFFDHGVAAQLPVNDVEVVGSPLIAYVLAMAQEEAGRLTVSTTERPALMKLTLFDPRTSQVKAFDDMPGTVISGRKSFTFTGQNCAGLLQMSFRKDIAGDNAVTESRFGAELQHWDGQDLRSLAYHAKLLQFFDLLADGWQLEFSLELEGRELLRGGFGNVNAVRPYAAWIQRFLEYTKLAQSLATHLDQRIVFSSGERFSIDLYRELVRIVKILDGNGTFGRKDYDSPPIGNASFPIDEFNHAAFSDGAVGQVRFVQEAGDVITIFGQEIELPPIEVTLESVAIAVVKNEETDGSNDSVDVQFVGTSDFRSVSRYLRALPN